MNFVLKTRKRCIKNEKFCIKTRNFVLKMTNLAVGQVYGSSAHPGARFMQRVMIYLHGATNGWVRAVCFVYTCR